MEETVNWTPNTGQQAVLQSWDQNCKRGRINQKEIDWQKKNGKNL